MTRPATTEITILDAIDSPSIWRSWFRDPTTWAPWRTFLAALFGLPLDGNALPLFQQCTGRSEPPSGGFNEAWLICGRRAGKSFVLALIAVFLAVFRDWAVYLAPGEVGTIKVVAVDRRQARVIFRYALALLTEVPALARLIVRQSDDEIELSNGITIEVQTASFRSIRGFTIIALLIDEIAYLRNDETSANPDAEILIAGRAAQATLQGRGFLLTAGSPYARRGEQFKAWRAHYGKDDAPVLVWQAATRVMNATVPQSFIDEQMERDPEASAAEYLAEFRSDLADYIDRAAVEAAVVPGRFELLPQPGISYIGAIDVSGGSSDSMVLAIAHAGPDDNMILDAVREARPPFSPEAEAAAQAELARAYGLVRIVGDRYGGLWPVEAFGRYGIAYEAADRSKSDFYKDLLPLLNSGKVDLLDNTRLVNQLCSLERRTARSGKDSIDHPPGSHDDLANAAALGLVLASIAAAPALWRRSDLHSAGAALPWPLRCLGIFASAAVDGRGIAVMFWANGAGRYLAPHDGKPHAVLIDYWQRPLDPGLFRDVADRLAALAGEAEAHIAAEGRRANVAHGVIIATSPIAVHAEAAGLRVRDGDPLLAPVSREALVLAAAAEIAIGAVKIAAPAEATSLHVPLPLTEVRTDAVPSAAGDAALLGIAAAMPKEMWPPQWDEAA